MIADTIEEIYADFHGFEKHYFQKNIEDSIKFSNKNNIFNTLEVNINFLNFNYTDTLSYLIENTDISTIVKFFDECIESQYQTANIRISIQEEHVHATLEDGMYLGINSENQCINEFFNDVSDMEELIKPLTKDYFFDDSTKNTQEIILSTDLLIVFGMSFGETDQIYWDTIKDTLQSRSETFQLILNIYNKNYTNNFISAHQRSYRRNQNILKNLFFEKVEFSSDNKKQSAMRRTHPILNSNKIFNFNKKLTKVASSNDTK
ncbi:AbiH family protein [Enterococcus sp. DIV0840]|uniref:AbiH family protein n=1 Tax=Enterococcus sp. DIV0840 TaxID=2775001 RepID=UPI003D2FEACA